MASPGTFLLALHDLAADLSRALLEVPAQLSHEASAALVVARHGQTDLLERGEGLVDRTRGSYAGRLCRLKLWDRDAVRGRSHTAPVRRLRRDRQHRADPRGPQLTSGHAFGPCPPRPGPRDGAPFAGLQWG